MAPGPEVAMQTPSSPVNFAWAQAMNAAISSWRTWMNLICFWARHRAPQTVDTSTGAAIDPLDAPFQEPADQKIGIVVTHGRVRSNGG
jgi:hypothetical protein